MKKLLLASIVLLIVTTCFSQDKKQTKFNDFDIANALIFIKGDSVINALNSFNMEYWITNNDKNHIVVFISYNNSVRLWELKVGNLFREILNDEKKVASDVVTEVFVRYRHSNLNDLRDFNLYDLPTNRESRTFEKEFGVKLSHYRVVQN